ncbi:uncharacterized protein EAE97_008097 [Botrytis byssoidea]|uniref:Uncharacterized protein n=1 Tax=Botrytis byssoidea TaxID=139641 RepID=A0A9P5LZ16_9HELO|nr:uncharacterized protein EAE97_008097 [Botrytis byssoidea]KAF7935190.1 hypothetical protein EAE97_008097 [Botrytis byssoidea]
MSESTSTSTASPSRKELMLEVLFAQRGFSISPFKTGMQRLEEVGQTIAMPSIHHLNIGLGIIDNHRLGLKIVRNTPSVLLAKMSQDAKRRWLRARLLVAADDYLRYCRGDAFARLAASQKFVVDIYFEYRKSCFSGFVSTA